MSTSITCTKAVSQSAANPPVFLGGGYRLDLAVTSATGISPKVFIMQREVDTAQAPNFTDTFYSVASVEQMESVPDASSPTTPFYRSDSISLMFATLEELEFALQAILTTLSILKRANDLANTMQSLETLVIP